MKIAAAAESVTGEPQAAATPETIRKAVALGAPMSPPNGRRDEVGFLHTDHAGAGAALMTDAVNGAEMVLHDCQRPYFAVQHPASAGRRQAYCCMVNMYLICMCGCAASAPPEGP